MTGPIPVPAPAFALEPGETLWQLPDGALVTVSILRVPVDEQHVGVNLTGRQVDATGATILGPLPRTVHSFDMAVFSTGQTTPEKEFARLTAYALEHWPAYIAAMGAFADVPFAPPAP